MKIKLSVVSKQISNYGHYINGQDLKTVNIEINYHVGLISNVTYKL